MRFSLLLVFFASFCLMVIELVAGRIMAPTLGVSLYTWTSIIAVILSGITMGNYVGGRVADRMASRLTLGAIFVVSSLSTLGIVFMARAMNQFLSPSGASLLLSTLQYSLFVFFAPAFFLSFVTPMVVKLRLHDLSVTGSTVGNIYAWSAFGSIVGTVATGYFFIDLVGTNWIIIAIAAALGIVGLVLIGDATLVKNRKFYILVLLFITALALPTTCTTESKYYCINVQAKVMGGYPDVRIIKLDHLVHSYVVPDDTTGVKILGYDYEELFALLVAANHKPTDPLRAFFIGGGGYVGPRYFEKVYPQSELTVAEIDPRVTEINFTHLGLSRDTRIDTTNGDARMTLKSLDATTRFDYIFGDAFNDLSIPYHLTTQEFNQLLKSHLTPNGWYALNVIDEPTSGRFISSVVTTLQQSVRHVYLLPGRRDWQTSPRSTFVVFASDQPLDRRAWESVTLPVEIRRFANKTRPEDTPALIHVVDEEELRQYIETKRGMILTDQFVPVDGMLTPVFGKAF